jgi:F-type H+-transporting ATPase subunit b
VASKREEDALEALQSLGINPIYLLSYIVNFIVLVVVLRLLLYKPILNMFEARRAKIEKGLQDARAAESALANAENEQKRLLDAARGDGQKVRAEAAQQAEQDAAKIRSDAAADAKKIRDEAMAELGNERDKMLSELRGQVAALAIAATNKLIGESLDRKRQETLIADFFAKVPANARASLGGATGEAEVISAVPLTAEEQSRVKKELALTAAAFRVDPRLLGGLRVRVGDRVVDGTVASQLESLRGNLS